MYDQLWNESPTIKKMQTESEIKGSQKMLINFVKVRYPALAELAQQHVTRINKPDALELLAQQIYTAPDENTVRWLFTTPIA